MAREVERDALQRNIRQMANDLRGSEDDRDLKLCLGLLFVRLISESPFCVRYNACKTAHKEKWWLSYL